MAKAEIPCKALPIKCPENFFEVWVEWLKPIHGLTNGEQKLLAAILRHRYNLSKGITDPEMLEKMCMDSSNLEKIRESLEMSPQQMNGIMLRLKKAKVIAPVLKLNGRAKYYKIANGIIPKVDKSGHTRVLLDFNYAPERDIEAGS